ncbi:hypothetical protein [Micromonospora sp. RTGN7]|uniref:hypothetical protein n=1 Tax=Micromonospora sp. RTGN7 TaxID=3016526 RepID=UPI0029FF2DD1|nr:hypothetical protein [Micromonospora sp. RTGN7]
MARRGWEGSIATAVGVAAGAGAAQLGFGYGLGIINWAATDVGAGETAWVASLAWATWIASTSTIAGAVCAQRLRQRGADGSAPDAPAVPPARPAPHSGDPQRPTTVDASATKTPDGSAPADPLTESGPVDPVAQPGSIGVVVGPDRVSPTGVLDPAGVPGDGLAAGSDATGSTPARAGSGRGGDGGLGSAVLALAGGFGALVTVLLVAVPARVATVPAVSAPQITAAAYAGAGVLIGVLIAGWVLRSSAAAFAVIATTGWLWLLAVVAVVDGVLAGRGLTTAQLGIWQLSADRPGFWLRDWFYWPGALLALASALLIGALAARRAARSPQHRLGAAASGAAGPLLVALAYLLATPGIAAIGREQVSAHLVAPYAVLAGLAGSMLTAALAQRAAARRAGPPMPAPVTVEPTRGTGGSVAVPRQRPGGTGDAPGTPAAAPLALNVGAGAEPPATTVDAAGTGSGDEIGAAGRGDPGAVRTAEPDEADGVPGDGTEVAATRRSPTVPKPRGGRRTR